MDTGSRSPRVLSAKTLIGDKVRNPQGEDLGDIDEFMIDLNTGKIAYAVLSFGGFLGMGEKLFAIPWQVLKLDTDEKKFILDVPKAKLESAPGFDKDHWPDTKDVKWHENIHDYYGVNRYWMV